MGDTYQQDESFQPPDLGTPLARIHDRALCILDSINVFRTIGIADDDETLRMAATYYAACNKEFELLAAENAAEDPAVLALVEEAVEVAELAVFKLDSTVPMDVFNKRFHDGLLPQSLMAHFARLLATRPLGTHGRRDRFEFLATRLLRRPLGLGAYVLANREEVGPLLGYLIPKDRRLSDAKIREAAVAYFEEVRERIFNIDRVDDIFESGLYLDIFGYKISLSDDILDPDIIYAAAAVNVTLSNRIFELVVKPDSPVTMDEVREKFTTQEIEVRKIYEEAASGSTEHTLYLTRFNRERKKVRNDKEITLTFQPTLGARSPGRRKIAFIVLWVFIAVGGIYSYRLNFTTVYPKQEISTQELNQASPIIKHATTHTNDLGEISFLGELQPSVWDPMDQKEREKAIEEVRRWLVNRNYYDATFFIGNQVAFTIDLPNTVMYW